MRGPSHGFVRRSYWALGASFVLSLVLVGLGEWGARPSGVRPPDRATLRAIQVRTTRPEVIAELRLGPGGYRGRSVGDFGELSLAFERPEEPVQLGVYLSSARRVVQVALNENVLSVDVTGRSDSPVGDQGPVLLTFPEAFLREGENQLQVAVASTPETITSDEHGKQVGDKQLWPLYIGPVPELRSAYQLRLSLGGSLIAVSIGASAFVALIVSVLAWSSEDRRLRRTLALLLVLCGAYGALHLGLDAALPFEARFAIYTGLRLATAACFAAFVLAWSERSSLGTRRALLSASAVVALLCFGAQLATQLALASLLTSAAVVLSCGYAIFLLAGDVAPSKPRALEGVWIGTAASLWVFDAAVELLARLSGALGRELLSFQPLSAYAPITGLVLSLGVVVALLLRMAEARDREHARVLELDHRVKEKEREIAEAYAREQESRAERVVLEERQRILQDMHDGFGHHLVGLILQTKADRLGKAELLRGLEASLDDLRLMVDSLDQAGDSLQLALGAFRGRLEPRCEALGIRLDWHVDDGVDGVALGTSGVLHLYRILQEAFANAVSHGHAKTVALSLRPNDQDSARIELELRDDGCGFDPERVKHRGLLHMQRRSRSIGAELKIATGAHGTSIVVSLPRADGLSLPRE